MKRWIVFFTVPILTIIILKLLLAFIMGYIFQIDPVGFWGVTASFIVNLFFGMTIFHCSPGKNVNLAYFFAFIYSAFGVYIGLSSEGQVMQVMGESVITEFSWVKEIILVFGIFSGIFGAFESEKEERA
ncbi:hypothetical protein [Halomonas sp. CSM-2]|uniref:hypothetical protein n=1 Tax=Halomonas sp. CSM-2 TaxID=1975722 RepID=UPI000A280AC3|nr:hypothetical protein [Halomonas sp. CSM-2]